MKTVCVYHKNCFDGMCSAWIVWKKYPDSEFVPMQYGEEFPFHMYGKNDDIIVVDFSFKRNIMEAIKQEVNDMIVLDHHKTAQKECEKLDYCIFDMNESGASLSWKYFFPNKPLPNLVKFIADRDLWKFELEDSKYINAYIQSFPMTLNDYEFLYQKLQLNLYKCKIMGESIERYKETMVKSMCDNAILRKVGDYEVPTVNATLLFSEIGHELCKRYPDKPFAASFFIRNDNKTQWSLRSIGDFDVSEVARKMGGGGHKNAAGFETEGNQS